MISLSLKAFSRIRPTDANSENQYAQYNLGKIYADADNFDKAEQYLLQSAESGLTQAKTLLGELYMSSENDENINKAFNWLHSAADEDDDRRAQFLLANLYRRSGDMTHYEEYIKKSGYKKPSRSRKKAPMIRPRIRQQSMSAMSVIRHVQIQQEIHTNKILSQFESDFNAQVAKRRYENEHGITLG
ncbi:MAG: hypothetical protein LUC25_01870 [Ruminococcus sp.]|nr:hypothetical protein [Ruminococcus sp.]